MIRVRCVLQGFALGLFVLPYTGRAAADPSPAVLARIEGLNWITEQYPPFNFTDTESGKVTGITVDVLLEMFGRMGVKLSQASFKVYPWTRGYRLAQKQPGTALFSMTYTDERAKLFKFVGPIVPTRVSVIAKKSRGISISDPSDLEGLKIGVIRDDVGDLLLREMGIDQAGIVHKADADGIVRMLYRDRLDAIAYAEDIVRHQTRLAGLDPAECEPVYLLKASEMGYAFHRDTEQEIVDALQATLDAMRSDGTVDRIRSAYLE